MSLKTGRYRNILDTINKIKPKTILELGTWNGNHAVEMIQAAQQYVENGDNIVYYGFDLFEDFTEHETEFCPKKPANYKDVAHKLIKTNATIQLTKGNTKDTLFDFCESYKFKPIDFIFMDGGHSLKTIQSDWGNISKLIGKETVVLIDDCYVGVNSVGTYHLFTQLDFGNKYEVHLLEPADKTNNGFSNQIFSVALK